MSNNKMRSVPAIGISRAGRVDMTVEIAAVAVSDVDRATRGKPH